MSRVYNNNYNNNTRQTVKQKKFCGVCQKAGKPESEYTSHFTKSEPGLKGIVTCPIIKSNQCSKCEQYGHFPDHCSFVKSFTHDNISKKSHHVFETPKKKIVLQMNTPEPTYEDLFPPLSGVLTGVKRSRDSEDKNNQYSVLQNIDLIGDINVGEVSGIVKPISYKKMLEKEVVLSDLDSCSDSTQFVHLHSYVKKDYQKRSFIHDDVDITMSKRILPVEINEEYLMDSDDDADWDGSWY